MPITLANVIELLETSCERAEVEVRSAPIASFGPTARDRAISAAIYGEGIPELTVCCWWGISPLTCRNVARRTMRWCAREQAELDRMSLAELRAELARLEDLYANALSAWHASKKIKVDEREKSWTRDGKTHSVLTITRTPRTGDARFLEIAQRLSGRLRIVATQLELRERESVAKRTTPPRTRRRKRMGGRGLRLPTLVGTAPRALPATACQSAVFARLCVRKIGIPPPDARSPASHGTPGFSPHGSLLTEAGAK